MVYYVRFLKTPRIQPQKGALFITALICITTDLGDSFLAEDVELSVTAWEQSGISHEKKTTWNAYHRELPITLGPLPASLARLAEKTLVLTVNSARPEPEQSTSTSESFPLPLVMGATSAPFGPHSPADKLVQRHITASGLRLNVWEETGNSIARHIWDAGFASVIYIHRILSDLSRGAPDSKGRSQMPALHHVLTRNSSIQVVELGAGCGIVGIGLAQMVPHCSVLLTDLPEVEEIITRNMNAARPAPQSRLRYQNLDWEQPLDHLGSLDLILVSDCTYNADSLPVLVSCLDRLVQASPGALVLVSLKRRHDSETVFFDLMQTAGFTSAREHLALPAQHEQVDEIEFYCFSR
ncbi:unnamed protein product [Penicillium egyptiacum]|uniref:Uncharacterized protein n=1 Tax=Penicillium egyptiacum TaxID=1303716 RepID=A0A9W4KGT0_9EURO|nr:unnamed protein product [Penicillium egyptiacum]